MRILLLIIQKVAFESLRVLRIWLNDTALLKSVIYRTRRRALFLITPESEFTILGPTAKPACGEGPAEAGPLSPKPPKSRP